MNLRKPGPGFWPIVAIALVCGVARGDELDLDNSDEGVCRFILARWAEAQGGANGVAAIRGYEAVQQVQFGNNSPPITVHVVETSAGHIRLESTTPGSGTLVQAFDGVTGWRSHGQWGLGPMSRADIESLLGQARLDTAESSIQAYPIRTLLPSDTVDGRSCFVIGATGRDGVQEKWSFDKESHELVKTERPLDGSPNPEEIYFSDFRRAGGLILPFSIRILVGSWSMTVHRTRLVINPPVDESSFVLTMDQLKEINAVATILDRNASVTGMARERAPQFRSRVIQETNEYSATGLKESVSIFLKAPHLVRYQIDAPGMGRTVEAFDGQSGWMESDILGFRPLKPAEALKLEEEAGNYLIPALIENFPLRRLVGERLVNGRHAVAIALSTLNGPDGTYYFDQESGRLLRVVPPAAKNPTAASIDFSDFRTVNGFEIPFVRIVNNYAGQKITRLQSICTDIPVDDALFAPPSVR